MKFNYEDENVKIRVRESKSKSPKIIALVDVFIKHFMGDFIEIKGFVIWSSDLLNGRLQEKLNITPPSIQIFGKRSTIVYIQNETFWFEIEGYIYSALLDFRRNRKDDTTEESIDLKDIPF